MAGFGLSMKTALSFRTEREEAITITSIMSATPSQLIRLSFVVVLVLRTLSCFIGTEAAIYRPSNYADKKQVQDIKVVFSNVHSLMFCRDCDDPLSEGSIGEFL